MSADRASAWLLRALSGVPLAWSSSPLGGVRIEFSSGAGVEVLPPRFGPPVAAVRDPSGVVVDAWPLTSRESAGYVARELRVRESRP